MSTEAKPTTSRMRRLLERLGRYYSVALLVALCALLGFAWLADGVMESEFADFNRSVMLSIHSYQSPTLDSFALAASYLGSVVPTSIIVAIVGTAFLLRRRRIDAIALGSVMLGSLVLVFVLKATFHQIRPQVFVPLSLETSFSFPSGHTLTAFCLWGFFAEWLIRQNPREPWRWLAAVPLIAIAATIGLSRIYLGVHWPTDVAAGVLVAVIWTTTVVIITN